MKRDDVQRLLGGWAAGTLTEAERSSLLKAALEDQELFDRLMEEEPLRDALADPAIRSRVARALEPAPRRTGWFARPWAWGFAGTAAATAVVVFALVEWNRTVLQQSAKQESRVEMAGNRQPAPPAGAETPQALAPSEASKQAPAPREFAGRRAAEPRRPAPQEEEHQPLAADTLTAAPKKGSVAETEGPQKTAGAPAVAPEQAAPPATPAFAARANETAEPGATPSLAVQSAPPRQAVSDASRFGGAVASAPEPAEQARTKAEAASPAPRGEHVAFLRRPAVPSQGARALFERRDAARNMAVSPMRQTAAAVVPLNSVGLRYRILRSVPATEGFTWTEADPDQHFNRTDALRLEIGVNDRAYYYVIVKNAVFASGVAMPAEPQAVLLPPGVPGITLVASRVPLNAPLEARQRPSGSMTEKSGGAVYVANAAFASDARVVAEITLRYKE